VGRSGGGPVQEGRGGTPVFHVERSDPFTPPASALPPSDDPEGDALVAESIARRARASAIGGLGLGLLAAVASAVPAAGAPLPVFVFGIFSGGPAVLGAVAVAAGVSALRALAPPDPHVGALLAPSRPLVIATALLAIGLGVLGASLGAGAFLLAEVGGRGAG